MTDRKPFIIPPGAPVPARVRSNAPALPALPSGNSGWPFERGRYERNALTVQAHTRWVDAKSAQLAAFAQLVKKKEDLMLAIASYEELPEKIAHQKALGRLDRLNELRMRQLQHELLETNARIEVAAANVRLAATLPIPEREEPAAAAASPPPSPALNAAEIRKAAQMLPELDGKPELVDTLVLVLSGMLAEKHK